MARCGECFKNEFQCTCAPPAGPRQDGWVWTLPDGRRYLDRNAAAGMALLGILAGAMMTGAFVWLTHAG